MCASTAAALAGAETATRLFLPQDIGLRAPWFESHPIYRFRHYPNMNEMRRWGTSYRLRTNSQGVRADRDEPYSSPGEIRVVVHGDSMTFGVGVDNGNTFVHRLETALRRRDRRIDVLNLGVSGHGPDNEYLLFGEEGRKYSPRVCVIAVSLMNDLDDLARPDAAFRLEEDRLAYIPYEPRLAKRLAENAVYRWIGSRSHLLVLLRTTMFDEPEYVRVQAAVESQPAPLSLAVALYRRFVAEVREAGAVPVILLLPSMEEVAFRRMITAEPPKASSTRLHEALNDLCAALQLTCIDALDAIAGSRVPFEALFIPGDDHYTAEGHRIIAEILEAPVAAALDVAGSS